MTLISICSLLLSCHQNLCSTAGGGGGGGGGVLFLLINVKWTILNVYIPPDMEHV